MKAVISILFVRSLFHIKKVERLILESREILSAKKPLITQIERGVQAL
jgi:hypothetical protein